MNLIERRDVSVRRELFTWDDNIVLIRSKCLPQDNSVQYANPAATTRQCGHGLDMAEVIGTGQSGW